jgi:hypothetical protein
VDLIGPLLERLHVAVIIDMIFVAHRFVMLVKGLRDTLKISSGRSIPVSSV